MLANPFYRRSSAAWLALGLYAALAMDARSARADRLAPEASEESVARAEETPAPGSLAPDADEDDYDDGDAKKSSWKWSGRLFVRDTLSHQSIAGQDVWRNQQGVDSARVGLKYRHKGSMRAVVKLDIQNNKVSLKDGYIRLKAAKDLQVQAGRFKRQMSAIALTSKWDLPSVERGLLSSLTVEDQDLPFSGGRGDGVMLRYRAPITTHPTLYAALYQNGLGSGAVALDASEHFAQDFYLRATIEPRKKLTLASALAVIGYLGQTGDGDSFRHAPVGSLELVYDGSLMRAWVEGFVGKSMFARADGSTSGNFLAARALLSTRLKTGIPRRLEPFVGLSYFDPRRDEDSDANTEVIGGLNLAFSKIWRVQVEVAQGIAQGNASSATDSTTLRLQLGAQFKD